MNEKINILNKLYEVAGHANLTDEIMVPIINIPMMSDERWNELARQQKGGTGHE